MSYCFMNYVYTDGENKLHELVKFDEDKMFDFEIFYCTESQLLDLFKANEHTFDFKVINGYLVWDGPPAMTVKPTELSNLAERGHTYKQGLPSIYTLFTDLVNNGGYYIPSSVVTELDEVAAEDSKGITSFSSLKISKSTMSVYLSMLTEDNWKARNFLYVENGFLTFSGFHFMVPQNTAQWIRQKYGFPEIVNLHYFGKYMSIFKVEPYSISIYPHIQPNIILSEPMINHKVYTSEREKAAIDFIDHFVAASLKAVSKDQIEEQIKIAKSNQYVPREDAKYNVLLDFKGGKLPSKSERAEMLTRCITIFDEHLKYGWDPVVAYTALSKYNYSSIRMYCCLTVLKAISSEVALLDKIQHAQAMKEKMKLSKLMVDLELHGYRALMFSEVKRLPFDSVNYLISGGKSEYPTEILKKLKHRI